MQLQGAAVMMAYVLGAVAFISGIAHWVAVTMVAYGEGRGYDARLGNLLVIGIIPVVCGAAAVAGAMMASNNPRLGFGLAAAASGLMALVLVLLLPGLTKGPGGSTMGTVIGIIGYAAGASLAFMAR